MKMSMREILLGLITLAVALFGGTGLLARSHFQDWKDLRTEEASLLHRISLEQRLVDQRDTWADKLSQMSQLLPVEPRDRDMDVHWLSVMDRAARKHGVTINKRLAREETQMGDIYELPIECKEWEGDLDSLVHFLFELQSESAMLDIRQLLIKPKPKAPGVLRGRFTLYCAYTREKEEG